MRFIIVLTLIVKPIIINSFQGSTVAQIRPISFSSLARESLTGLGESNKEESLFRVLIPS